MITRFIQFLFGISLFLWVSPNVIAQDSAHIKREIERIARENNIPSIGFAVVADKQILIADAVGVKNRESMAPADGQTTYLVGSVTKPFVALAIMRLVQDGELNLDDRVADLLPDFRFENPWEATHPVLLKHLLEHSSGFSENDISEWRSKPAIVPPLREVIARSPEYWITRWPPGTRHAYSNPGYALLGHIIEKTSGRGYNAYIKSVVFDPLGMDYSDCLGRDHSNLAISYDYNGKAQSADPVYAHPAAYLHSTPGDMAKFVLSMLQGTRIDDNLRILQAEYFDMMTRTHSIVGSDKGLLGYGLGLYTHSISGNTGLAHGGLCPDYFTDFRIFPDCGVGWYFTLTHWNSKAFSEVLVFLAQTLLKKKEIPPYTPQKVDLASLAGWYKRESYQYDHFRILADFTGAVKLEALKDRLVMTDMDGNSQELLPLGDGLFRSEYSSQATTFIGDHEGRTVISSSFGGYFEKGSPFSVLWRYDLLLVSLLVFAVGGVVMTGLFLWGKIKKSTCNLQPLGWMPIGLFSLAAIGYSWHEIGKTDALHMTVNPYTIAMAVFSALFACSLLLGLLSLRKGKVHPRLWLRVLVYLTYLGWGTIAAILTAYGHMPIMNWTW